MEDNEAVWYVYVLKAHLGICYWYISLNPLWATIESYNFHITFNISKLLHIKLEILVSENTNKMQ